ncbi:HPr family phosphocarrier protein [Microbacterium immunditiarum]|uniref:Phosphocarrier protein HPr n=1 Tax=Microbacterium immunditiarum TaxID=337480 RepID=A0A7Y9GMT9_9MICO|nr:HPr family phosphocarrier protein [Microbacterium immunditiarum]NYE19226.1 phosphocarrier protein [Microbacterium immunditiarum]
MPERTVTVASAQGLHARPAALFTRAAAGAGAKVTIAKGGKTVDAASILSVLSLGVVQGDEVTIATDGDDSVLDGLEELLTTDHDEE